MIPKGWMSHTIGEICHFMRGVTWKSEDESLENFTGSIPVIRIPNIKDRLDLSIRKFIDKSKIKNYEKYVVSDESILLVGSNGNPKRVGNCVYISNVFESHLFASFLVKANSANLKKITNHFLYWLLKSSAIQDRISEDTQGSTGLKNINLTSLRGVPIRLPPLPEQKCIAEILTSVDDAIQATEKVIEQTKRVKQGLLQELLTRGIGHTKFKKTEIGEIPESWKIGCIEDFAEVHNNKRLPISSDIRKNMKGSYPYYGPTKAIDWINEYRLDGEFTLLGEDGDHFLKFNDWSMTQIVRGKFNVNNHAHILKGNEKCSTRWIFHFFRHRNLIGNLTRQGAGRYKLKKATLLELQMVVPPPREQEKICDYLEEIDNKVQSNRNYLNTLIKTKSGLMEDLLTGRVRTRGAS